MTSTINRRKALTVVAAAPAAVALGATDAVANSGESIQALIEAHKAAWVRVCNAIDQHEAADDRFDKEWDKDPVMVPMAILPNGKHLDTHYDISINDRDQLLKSINDRYERVASCRWMRAAIPDQAKVAEATLKDMKRRAVAFIDKAEAMLAEREKKAGITKAKEAYHAASDAEVDARVRLILAEPRTKAEAKAKAEYLSACVPMRDGWCKDEDFAEALLRHCGVEV